MAETTPLLVDIDDNTPHNGEFEGETHVRAKETPASAYFMRLIKMLNILSFILAIFTIVFIIANYIVIIRRGSEYGREARRDSLKLGIVIFVSFVFSIINMLTNFPILLNLIVDVVLTPFIIGREFRLFDAFPASYWCEYRFLQPGLHRTGPTPQCLRWKLAVTVLMAFIAVFAGIIAVIYLIQLLLRAIAIFKTKFWKKLSWTFPTGTISLQISFKVLKQENTTSGNVQNAAETGSNSVTQASV